MPATVQPLTLPEAITPELALRQFSAVGPQAGPRLSKQVSDKIRRLRNLRHHRIDIWPDGVEFRLVGIGAPDVAWASAEPVRWYIAVGEAFGWQVTAENCRDLIATLDHAIAQAEANLVRRPRA